VANSPYCALANEELKPTAQSVAAGSLRSPAAFYC